MSQDYIADLVRAYPTIREVWLIGSRANDNSQKDSDWDYLVFADEEFLSTLTCDHSIRRSYVDLLVVYNGDNFQAPWGKKTKSGSLSQWEWKQLTATRAQYKGTKWKDDDVGAEISVKQAQKIWPA